MFDVQDYIGKARRKPTSETSAVSLSLAPEEVERFRALLVAVGIDGDAIEVTDELMPAELKDRSAANRAGNLSAYLRSRFCGSVGGDGTFIWVSGYAGKKGEPDEGTVYIVARSVIPEGAKPVKSGKWNRDGTPVEPTAS